MFEILTYIAARGRHRTFVPHNIQILKSRGMHEPLLQRVKLALSLSFRNDHPIFRTMSLVHIWPSKYRVALRYLSTVLSCDAKRENIAILTIRFRRMFDTIMHKFPSRNPITLLNGGLDTFWIWPFFQFSDYIDLHLNLGSHRRLCRIKQNFDWGFTCDETSNSTVMGTMPISSRSGQRPLFKPNR